MTPIRGLMTLHITTHEPPSNPKSPCTSIAYTLAPKYLVRDYFKAKVYTIWVHGSLYLILQNQQKSRSPSEIRGAMRATVELQLRFL